jgi:hypothetical protein
MRPIITRASIAIGAAILLALLVVQIRRAPETYPWGDTATTSIYTLRAARGNLAIGAYSRFHWNHPGPLLYQLLAPLYVLSGQREISIKWTVLMLNIGVLAGLLAVVWRPAPLLSVLIALAFIPLLYREQRLLFWAWNPIVPLLPFAFATALSARIGAGSVSLLPLFCGVASLIVQTHVGFAPLIAGLAGTMTALVAWRMSRHQIALPTRDVVRSIAIGGAVLIALWAVPFAHELENYPGNLRVIFEFFRTAPRQPLSFGTVFGIVASQLVGPYAPGWELTTAEASAMTSWPTVVLAAIQFPLLAAVSIRAFRRGAFFAAAFALTCLAVSLAGFIAVRSVVGPVSDYLIVWLAVIGALNVAAIASEALHVFLPSLGVRRRLCRWVLVAYVIVATAIGGSRLIGKHSADARSMVVRPLATELERYCRTEGIERPLLRFSGPSWQVAVGMVLQFYKERRQIALADDMVFLVGDPFKSTGRETAEFYLMLQSESVLPDNVTRHVWVTTSASYRLVRVFREQTSSTR